MSIDNNHVTKLGELKSLIDQLWGKIKSTFSAIGHTHTKSDVTDFPTNVSAFENDSGYLTEETVPQYELTAEKVAAVGEISNDTSGNAATASNARGKKFTIEDLSSTDENYLEVSNGTQKIYLDVLTNGDRRGIYYNESNDVKGGWALYINKYNVVTLNGTATYANTAKKLDVSAKIGSSSNPVFIGANGVPSECGFGLSFVTSIPAYSSMESNVLYVL